MGEHEHCDGAANGLMGQLTVPAIVLVEELKVAINQDSSDADTVAANLVAAVAASGDARLIAQTRARVERLKKATNETSLVDCVEHDNAGPVLDSVERALHRALTAVRLNASHERLLADRSDERPDMLEALRSTRGTDFNLDNPVGRVDR